MTTMKSLTLATSFDKLSPEAVQHLVELQRLDDIAFIFLHPVNGDIVEAETLLDNFIDLILEDGNLSTWRYRILLAKIREGL